MTLIENMSEPERRSWITLIVDICVFYMFFKIMLGRLTLSPRDLNISEVSAQNLVGVYIWIIVVTVILHIIIASTFALRGRSSGYESDERDVEIERKGARNGFWVVSIAINIIIFHLLFENLLPGEYIPLFSVLSPTHMFFALMSTMFLGDIVYRATMVLAYRKDAV